MDYEPATQVTSGDDCLAQLQRTADWLRSLPLARLEREDGAIADAARTLIASVNDLVAGICRAVPSTHCPPAGAVPDYLAPHGLGDQLAVHAQDLARCLAAAEVASSHQAGTGAAPPAEVSAAEFVHIDAQLANLATRALALRKAARDQAPLLPPRE